MASRAGFTDSIGPAFTEVTAWQPRSFWPRGLPVYVARRSQRVSELIVERRPRRLLLCSEAAPPCTAGRGNFLFHAKRSCQDARIDAKTDAC